MIRWTGEFEPVKNGFNFYRPSDKSSIGFKLRIGRNLWLVRYSKNVKKFMFSHFKRPKD